MEKGFRRLNNLPRDGYERFAKKLVEAEGFQDVVIDHSKDGDLAGGYGVYRANLIGYGIRFLFVRNLPVANIHVRILERNTRSPGDRRLLVSTGTIGSDIRDLCRRTSSYIDIVDGDMLCEACKNSQFGLRVTPPTDEKVETNLRDFENKKSTRVHGSTLYCDAWQHMASEVCKDCCRVLCAEISSSNVLGRRKILGEQKEDLSDSTQEYGCFCEVSVGEGEHEITWLVNHGLSNKDKVKFLLLVAEFAFRRESGSKSESSYQYVVDICEQIKNMA